MTMFQLRQLLRFSYLKTADGWERNRQILTSFGAKGIKYDWDNEQSERGAIPTEEELKKVEEWGKQFKLK